MGRHHQISALTVTFVGRASRIVSCSKSLAVLLRSSRSHDCRLVLCSLLLSIVFCIAQLRSIHPLHCLLTSLAECSYFALLWRCSGVAPNCSDRAHRCQKARRCGSEKHNRRVVYTSTPHFRLPPPSRRKVPPASPETPIPRPTTRLLSFHFPHIAHHLVRIFTCPDACDFLAQVRRKMRAEILNESS